MGIRDLHCPDCGKSFDENERYCPHCGADMEALAVPDPETEKEYRETVEHYIKSAQRALNRHANLDLALLECETALEYSPESAEAHNLRGLILDELGRPQAAMESYQEAIRLDPTFEDARSNLRDAEIEQQNKQLQSGNMGADQKNDLWPKILIAIVVVLLCAGGVIGTGFLAKYALPYLQPRKTLILEPDFSKISTVDPANLEKTAQILTERCDQMGCSSVNFTVSESNQIVGKIPAILNIDALVKKITAIGLLEFTDFGTSPVAVGDIVRTDFENAFLHQVEGTVRHTIMTNQEIETVSVTKAQTGEYQIAFTLTEQGANIFFDYSSKNTGKYLGILLDKVVLFAPIISTAITDGNGIIQGRFTFVSAQDLAAYLQISPLPIPLVIVDEGQ
jgi:preprotein translocase subunit SecD